MHLVLKPISRPNLHNIVITDGLFAIGRAEDPFFAYDSELVAHLSRRHARIFEEGGGIYIADLGSRNGTKLNDKPVEFKPARLLSGDRLSFASELEYEVEVLSDGTAGDAANDAANDAEVSLTLFPADSNATLAPIAISQFPFLIGKKEAAFAESSQQQPDKLSYLSHRHAHFFIRNGIPYIEDLASTNGTTLNGERLEEHLRALNDGDIVVFGGNHFAYRVSLSSPGQEAQATHKDSFTDDEEEECHTIHVSAANTFLDIFCVEEAENAEPTANDVAPDTNTEDNLKPKNAVRQGFWYKIKTFSRELKSAFDDGNSSSPTVKVVSVSVVVALALLATAIYYSGKPVREMNTLMEAKNYLQVAELANVYLAKHPEDDTVQKIATEATTKHLVGTWLVNIESKDFPAAENFLDDSKRFAQHNSTSATVLDLLGWITRLQQFMHERGGNDAAVKIYLHEEPINTLLAQWDDHSDEYQRTMRVMANRVPEFETLNTAASSQLRSLRNEKSVYLTAIEKMTTQIDEKLAAGLPGDLVYIFNTFSAQYPRVGGIDQLHSDLQAYLEIHAALEQEDRLQAAVLANQARFTTPPFLEKVEGLKVSLLPSEEIAKNYADASQAWRGGDLARALDILDTLAAEQDGAAAARELAQKQKIIADYATLQQFHSAADYGTRLLVFYSTLNPIEDIHFTKALNPDFQRYRTQAAANADQAWQLASERWREYRNSGGIRGLLRLEEVISERYTQQAGLLSQAYAQANYGKNIYELLGQEYSLARGEIFRQISAETALQRRSLKQLSMVLSPDLLNAKLDMLDATNTMAQLN